VLLTGNLVSRTSKGAMMHRQTVVEHAITRRDGHFGCRVRRLARYTIRRGDPGTGRSQAGEITL